MTEIRITAAFDDPKRAQAFSREMSELLDFSDASDYDIEVQE